MDRIDSLAHEIVRCCSFSRHQDLIRADDLIRSLSRHLADPGQQDDARLGSTAEVMTRPAAIRTVVEMLQRNPAGIVLAAPFGIRASAAHSRHPNPFFWNSSLLVESENPSENLFSATLSPFGSHSAPGTVELHVATLDDVQREVRGAANAPSPITRVLQEYFPAAYDARLLDSWSPRGPPPSPDDSSESEPEPEPVQQRLNLHVHAFRMRFSSLQSLGDSPLTSVGPALLWRAFERMVPKRSEALRIGSSFRIGSDFASRLLDETQQPALTQHLFLMLNSSFSPPEARQGHGAATQELVKIMERPASGFWHISLSRSSDEGIIIEVSFARPQYMRTTMAPLSRAKFEAELSAVYREVREMLLEVDPNLALHEPCMDAASCLSPWTYPSPARLVSATATFEMTPQSRIAARKLADAIRDSSEESSDSFLNVQVIKGSTIAFQWTRVHGCVRLSPEQQTVRLNIVIPPRILIAMLIEKHGMQRVDAQRLVDREFEQRLANAMNPPLLVIVSIRHDGTFTVTVNGPISEPIIERIRARLWQVSGHHQKERKGVSNNPPATANAAANAAATAAEDDHVDEEGDEEVPPELMEALMGYGADGTLLAGTLMAAPAETSRPPPLTLQVDTDPERMRTPAQQEDENIPARFIVADLQRADPRLFDVGSKDRTRYSRICGHTVLRQPVRVSPGELERIAKEFPGSITGSVMAGSSQKALADNRYICPKVWCPRSRVAMTTEQFDARGRKCPDANESPLIFDEDTYWKGRERHPGLLDPKFHPDGLCMPCCFLRPGRGQNKKCSASAASSIPGSGTKPLEVSVAAAVEAEAEVDDGNMRYIYSRTTILPAGRYGFLPEGLHGLLNSGSRSWTSRACMMKPMSHMSNRVSCMLRKGMVSGHGNIFACLEEMLGMSSGGKILDVVRENLDPWTFLRLHDGGLAARFIPQSLTAPLGDAAALEGFATWMSSSICDAYVGAFGLEKVREVVLNRSFAKAALSGTVLMTSPGSRVDSRVLLLQAAREYAIYLALERYLAELRESRSHELILDLVNLSPEWLNPRGTHFVVLQMPSLEHETVSIACLSSGNQARHERGLVSMILRSGLQYEAICLTTGIRGGTRDQFVFETDREPSIRALLTKQRGLCHELNRVQLAAMGGRTASLLLKMLNQLGEPATRQVVGINLACVGFLTSSGIFVPLPVPQGLVPGLKPAHLDAVLDSWKVDVGIQEMQTFFERLAALVQDSSYRPVRQVRLPAGGQGVLLNMGKLSPLLMDEDLKRKYQSSLLAFVNVFKADERDAEISKRQQHAREVERDLKRFTEAVQSPAGNPATYSNVLGVLAKDCPLPWDVRHRYLSWTIGLLLELKNPARSAEIADHLLLPPPLDRPPSRQLFRKTAATDETIMTIQAPPGRGLNADVIARIRHSLQNSMRDIEQEVKDVSLESDDAPIPASIMDALHERFGLNESSRVNSRISKRFRTTLTRRSVRTGRKQGRGEVLVMVSVHLASLEMLMDVMRYAHNDVIRPYAPPIERRSLEAVVEGLPGGGTVLLDALLALSKFLSVPVAAYIPESQEFVLQGSMDRAAQAIIVHIRTKTDVDLVMTARSTRENLKSTAARSLASRASRSSRVVGAAGTSGDLDFRVVASLGVLLDPATELRIIHDDHSPSLSKSGNPSGERK